MPETCPQEMLQPLCMLLLLCKARRALLPTVHGNLEANVGTRSISLVYTSAGTYNFVVFAMCNLQ